MMYGGLQEILVPNITVLSAESMGACINHKSLLPRYLVKLREEFKILYCGYFSGITGINDYTASGTFFPENLKKTTGSLATHISLLC